MEKFPGFGDKKPQKEEVTTTLVPVAQGHVKEQNEIKSILKEFISDDVKDIKKNLISRVLIPSVQKLVVDLVNNSVNWFFYGIKGNTNNRTNTPYQMMSGTSRIFTPYSNASTMVNSVPAKASSIFSFSNYGYDTRGEAELVLAGLQDILYQGKYARLSNYKILSRQPVTNVDENWGWRNLDNVGVNLQSDGLYYIQFPAIEDLTK